jgi:hypothetical protein
VRAEARQPHRHSRQAQSMHNVRLVRLLFLNTAAGDESTLFFVPTYLSSKFNHN